MNWFGCLIPDYLSRTWQSSIYWQKNIGSPGVPLSMSAFDHELLCTNPPEVQVHLTGSMKKRLIPFGCLLDNDLWPLYPKWQQEMPTLINLRSQERQFFFLKQFEGFCELFSSLLLDRRRSRREDKERREIPWHKERCYLFLWKCRK